MKSGRLLMAMAVSLALNTARPANACSICRCGDATFNALGTDIFSPGAFRIALDWDRISKSQGPPDESESEVQNGITATVSYSFGDRVNLVARIPYSFRTLTETSHHEMSEATRMRDLQAVAGTDHETSEVTRTSGLSDPEFFAWIRLWASDLEPRIGRRAWVSALVGVKTPWGQDDLTGPDGERLDQHAQPGTGSTDPFAGVGGFYLVDTASSFFGSVQYRWTGTNEYGYQYGRIFLANVGYERKLGSRVDGVLELNYRWAGKDTVDAAGEQDPDTGGAIFYVTPRVLVNLGAGFVARAAVLIPTFRNLNGYQTERAIVTAGLTYSF